jgi:hypothetical protein
MVSFDADASNVKCQSVLPLLLLCGSDIFLDLFVEDTLSIYRNVVRTVEIRSVKHSCHGFWLGLLVS